MSLTKDQKEFVEQTIVLCRTDVDRELAALRAQIAEHHLTEAQAEAIATRAAEKAKAMTKEALIHDAKLEIGNAAIEIMKRSAQVIGLFIVGLAFYLGSRKWPWD
ncbi:MAG: hypothetical protein MUF16_19900 [Burkholderiaceae bacterium]|nr:hypothetical protein [Burkholderiaceae bacterium]